MIDYSPLKVNRSKGERNAEPRMRERAR